MSQRPEDIRRDIENTRQQMGDTIQAIEDRVVPGRVVERQKARMGQRWESIKESIMGSSEPTYGSPPSWEAQPGTSPGLGDRAADVASGVADRASGVATAVQERASDVAAAVQERASDVAERVQQAPQAIKNQTRGNPLMAGAVAFGAGVVVAYALPASQDERKLARSVAQSPLVDKVRDEAKQVAQEVVSEVKESATQQMQDLQGDAQRQVQELKEDASQHAQEVKDAAQGAVQDVKDQASPTSPSSTPPSP